MSAAAAATDEDEEVKSPVGSVIVT